MIRTDKKWYRGMVLIAFGVTLMVVENFRFAFFDSELLSSSSKTSAMEQLSEQPTFRGRLLEHKNDTILHNDTKSTSLKRTRTHGAVSKIQQDTTQRQQQPQSNFTRTPPPPASQSSFCLLIKDDNDILPEWIAYHYHTMNMRRIIVALDPDSTTSPREILQQWRQAFRLNYTLWTDQDFMPKDFLEGDFSRVPDYLKGKRNKHGSVWHQDQNVSRAQIRQDLAKINHHRHRQRTFLAECYRQLKKEERQWTVHIDTDEFVTLNPLLRQVMAVQDQKTATGTAIHSKITSVELPQAATSGSLLSLWEGVYKHHQDLIGSKTCGLMPCLPFGSRESDGMFEPISTTAFNRTNLETLRWMYHGDHAPRPKSIVNVALIPDNHQSMEQGRVFDPHIPLFRTGHSDCHRRDIMPFNVTKHEALELQDKKAMLTVLSYPLYVNHYLGSLDRFLSRSDARRSESIYREKAKEGDGFRADEWIRSWVSQFAHEQGVKNVYTVLE